MESRNYLTDDESDNHCENNKESDQRNVLVDPGKLVAIDGHCYDDHNIRLDDLSILETGPDNDLPQIDVDSHENEKYLVKSIEAASIISSSIQLKLNCNRKSVKLLRRSLKVVERHLKSSKTRKSNDRKAKSEPFTRSNEKLGRDYRVSADETDSESQLKEKNTRKCKKLEKDVYKEDLYDQYDPKYAKRFPFILKWLDDFWFYNEIIIKNGRIVKSSLPSYISRKNILNIKQRSKASRQVNPNPRVFAHVQNEVPWPESDLEPLLTPVLSDTIIRRVLKGMSQGKLYNIDYKKLSKIFLHRIRMDKDERAKCPLCDNKYNNKLNTIKHIESIHTNFACFCGSCGQIYLRGALCLTHECTKR
ncbi:uncharacterized protein LOC128390845 [Panonychus citri]|uniref:uncharacterized protein LOC128390845 n=1 Tax=Panonychus citri TaxID=50023 RepID=UPI002307EE77|nr:uncharacterized protein LOC128390845 [Panonychus citri]